LRSTTDRGKQGGFHGGWHRVLHARGILCSPSEPKTHTTQDVQPRDTTWIVLQRFEVPEVEEPSPKLVVAFVIRLARGFPFLPAPRLEGKHTSHHLPYPTAAPALPHLRRVTSRERPSTFLFFPAGRISKTRSHRQTTRSVGSSGGLPIPSRLSTHIVSFCPRFDRSWLRGD
jgi:hypothetical protein